jgi:hypothetical protein
LNEDGDDLNDSPSSTTRLPTIYFNFREDWFGSEREDWFGSEREDLIGSEREDWFGSGDKPSFWDI